MIAIKTMVYTNYEIGRMIVEDEQQGMERAAYGKGVLKDLSKRLTARFGKGYSEDNLKLMRRFYTVYSATPQIGENSFPELENNAENVDNESVIVAKVSCVVLYFLI